MQVAVQIAPNWSLSMVGDLWEFGGREDTVRIRSFWGWYEPKNLVWLLHRALEDRSRVRVWYGDRKTGQDWMENYGCYGTIGRSMGPKPCPLILTNARSLGGMPMMVDRIVKIQGGVGRWIHPNYVTPKLRVVRAVEALAKKGYYWSVLHENPIGHQLDRPANFKTEKSAHRWVDFMLGHRMAP